MKHLLLSLILLVAPCMAGEKELYKQAMTLHEAGAFEEAIAQWQTLLQRDLSQEERAHVQYNIGCAFLEEGEWQKALSAFSRISLGKDPSPDLLKRIATNRGWAEWQAASADPDGEQDYLAACDRLLSHLLESWSCYGEAVKAQETINTLEGADPHLLTEELEGLRRAIKQRAAEVISQRSAWQLNHFTLQELFQRTHAALSQSIELLDLVGRVDLSDEEQHACLAQMVRAQGEASKLWRALREKLAVHSEEEIREAQEAGDQQRVSQAKGRERAVVEAESLFLQSVDWLAEGNLWKARHACLLSQRTLQLLGWQEAGCDLIEGCLERRVAARERVQSARQGSALAKALDLEGDEWTSLSKELCHAAAEQLLDTPGEEQQLLASLHQRLYKTTDKTKARACEDLRIYQILSEDPLDVLLALRQAIKEGDDRESWSHTLTALHERFLARERLEPDEARERIIQLLAAARTQKDPVRLLILVDQILKAYDMRAFVRARLLDAKEHAERALKSDQCVSSDLEMLRKEQEGLLKAMQEEEQFAKALPQTELALRDLFHALDEEEEGRIESAKAFLADDARALGRSAQSLEEMQEQRAGEILQYGLDEQQHAEEINQRLQQAASREPVGRAAAQMACGSEEQVLSVVKDFEEALLCQEGGQPQELSEETVEAVLELFQEGLREASRAKEHLSLELPEWRHAETCQRAAKAKWKEALSKLQNSNGQDHAQEEGSGQGEGGEGQQEGSSGEDEAQGAGEESVETASAPVQIFEWLQQMDEEDGPMERRKRPPRRGLKPW